MCALPLFRLREQLSQGCVCGARGEHDVCREGIVCIRQRLCSTNTALTNQQPIENTKMTSLRHHNTVCMRHTTRFSQKNFLYWTPGVLQPRLYLFLRTNTDMNSLNNTNMRVYGRPELPGQQFRSLRER